MKACSSSLLSFAVNEPEKQYRHLDTRTKMEAIAAGLSLFDFH